MTETNQIDKAIVGLVAYNAAMMNYGLMVARVRELGTTQEAILATTEKVRNRLLLALGDLTVDQLMLIDNLLAGTTLGQETPAGVLLENYLATRKAAL